MVEWRTKVSSLALLIAAENFRQHKMDQITVLEEEVLRVTRRREMLLEEREEL